jgi:hypothetical protein
VFLALLSLLLGFMEHGRMSHELTSFDNPRELREGGWWGGVGVEL